MKTGGTKSGAYIVSPEPPEIYHIEFSIAEKQISEA